LLFVFPINIDCYCCPIPFAFSDMTNQRIIYSNTNGTVSVIIPTGELSIEDPFTTNSHAGLKTRLFCALKQIESRQRMS
jgi:hypothetical protein